jgi:thiamine-phosphate pyrophosphorylase
VAASPNPPETPRVLALPAFYPILDVDVARARQLDPLTVLHGWLDAGVRLVQLRAKALSGAAFFDLAEQCAHATSAAGARLIVNDRAEIARVAGADGVHLGQDDLPAEAARRVLGSAGIIGWSTHNDEQLRAASAMPIDYVAIGPVFDTRSKVRPDPVVGIDGVRRAAEIAAGRPLVAIGGITLQSALDVIRAGASTVAVIGDVLHDDAAARARSFVAALGA